MDSSYFFSLVILVTVQGQLQQKCSLGLITEGYTYPPGDIVIEYGTNTSLEIICVYTGNCTNGSEKLIFLKDKVPVPSNLIDILNSTSIRLREDNPSKRNNLYSCVYEQEGVCFNNVEIGTKPQPINDFNCIGYNRDNFTCMWTPRQNFIRTNYSLTYTFPQSRPGSRANTCTIRDSTTDQPEKYCFWSLSSEPQYRQVQKIYNFTLTMVNKIGRLSQNFPIDHFSLVIPNPPQKLTSTGSTKNSINLTWEIPSSMVFFEEGLEHRILYQCEYGPKEMQLGGLVSTEPEAKNASFEIKGLPHAHAVCDIRVAMKVKGTMEERMWSKNASINVWTKSAVPGAPPKINIGSFEIITAGVSMQHRDVYIYWQQLPMEIRNGENFSYNFKVEDADGVNLNVEPAKNTSSSSFALFQHLTFYRTYTFKIWSKNSEGQSDRYSVVVVPAQGERVGEPTSFTKVAFGDGTYELSWVKPKYSEHIIKSYTLFWCSNKQDRPFQCMGYLNWTEVSSETTVYNITVSENQTTQFAISANSANSSSGMVWAACTVIHNKAIGKIKDVYVKHVGSYFINIGWNLDCSDRNGAIEGFVIYYCPIKSLKNPACKESQRNITIAGNSSVTDGSVNNLTPYTTYMLTVSIKTNKDTYSHQSDPVYNTTFEAAPSTPQEFEVRNVTSTSVDLYWNEPSKKNGVLTKYVIHDTMEQKDYVIDLHEANITSSRVKYVLRNLSSYHTYNFTVAACTKKDDCSNYSNFKTVQTKIGYPSQIRMPLAKYVNGSYMSIEWDEPTFPRGENTFDIMYKKRTQSGENISDPIYNLTERKYKFSCENTFFVSVRAVNFDNVKPYYGNWSQELKVDSCQPGFFIYWLIIGLITVALVIIYFLGRRLYNLCDTMRNVGIKLPDGLDPKNTENSWNSPKSPTEINRHSSADEQLLLDKLGDGRHSGDSSGCSSGQESVTSSLESASGLSSSSDSGTEQPRTPSSEERKNSLRLRNVASTKAASNKAYVPADSVSSTTWSQKSNLSGNYCVLGVDPNSPTQTESSYISIVPQADISQVDDTKLSTNIPFESSSTSPYVLAEDLSKHTNSGYVPITRELEKNPAYVMAGNKTVITDVIPHSPLQVPENNSVHVQISDLNHGNKGVPDPVTPQHAKQDILNNKSGEYVSFGDAPSSQIVTDINKSYVPHRHFDVKSLKED